MFINIGEKIKLHREEKKVSQDDFARYLGVTCKEVLKWENGELYPDFELIPTIANYFGVSTDELLCMEMFDNEDKIREYTDGFYEKVASGNIKDAVETAREGIMHFPDEYRLKVLLMYGLYLNCDRPAAIKHYSGEILEIGDDILSHCTEDPIRLEAKRLLCLHYYEDLNDTEKRERSLCPSGKKNRLRGHAPHYLGRRSEADRNSGKYLLLYLSPFLRYHFLYGKRRKPRYKGKNRVLRACKEAQKNDLPERGYFRGCLRTYDAASRSCSALYVC